MKLVRIGDMPFYQGKISCPDNKYGAVRIGHKVKIAGSVPYELVAVRNDEAGYWVVPLRVMTEQGAQFMSRYIDAVHVRLNRFKDPLPISALKNLFGDLWDDVQVCVEEPVKACDTKSPVKPSNPKDSVGVNKPSLSVLPTTALLACGVSLKDIHPSTAYTFAAGLYEGARKYGRHNYRAIGVRASVYYDAAMRHLSSHAAGETIDPDSGLPHSAKAVCTLLVLMDAILMNNCTDDRPLPLPSAGLPKPYDGDNDDDWVGLSCLCVRDRLAMWWDGRAALPPIVRALVELVDSETYKGTDWLELTTSKHKEITDRYPEPKAAFTRNDKVTQ